MLGRNFFQLRQLTRNLDDIYQEDLDIYTEIMGVIFKPDEKKLEYDKQILKDWEVYKIRNFEKIINKTLDSYCFKICLCKFQQKRKLSIEFWIKVAYEIFFDDSLGKEIRRKFWNSMRKKQCLLEADLQQKRWPEGWQYLNEESCLNLELIKLYEQFSAIRTFIASYLNTATKIFCDISRMPYLKEDRDIKINVSNKTWFPLIEMSNPDMLEQIFITDNYYCEQIRIFSSQMKDILFPILDLFKKENENGKSINLFGKKCDFILEALYSLKSFCGPKINYTTGSLRMRRSYKCQNSYFVNESTCQIMLTSLLKEDLCEEIYQDIYLNYKQGYCAFIQNVDNIDQLNEDKMKRLVLMLSPYKLNFKDVQNKVLFYQLPDYDIQTLIDSIDYEFVQHYSNLLFNKSMIVQQNCSSRKPFYQMMMIMWTYILAEYFSDDYPHLINSQVFNYMNLKQQQEFIIDLGLSPIRDKNEYNLQPLEIIDAEFAESIIIQSDIEDDCIILDKPSKYIKL